MDLCSPSAPPCAVWGASPRFNHHIGTRLVLRPVSLAPSPPALWKLCSRPIYLANLRTVNLDFFPYDDFRWRSDVRRR